MSMRGGKKKKKSGLPTYVGVAEGVLGVRESARAALRQLVNMQGAEDKQQADQVHWVHFSKLSHSLSGIKLSD